MAVENEDELLGFISSLPYSYDVDTKAANVRSDYQSYEGKEVSIAGRVMSIRKSGKLVFTDILDSSGKIQGYFDYANLGEDFDSIKSLNKGDIIGVKGSVFKTKPGEISINVKKFTLLAKALRPMPTEWYGLKDTELRYRKRYLDLMLNEETRRVFVTRSRAIALIRKFLDGKGFIEFETPVIQPIYGGGDAEPFKTYVNTLEEEDYLRIADELYLKRLIIGGFDKVYEICKDFRNEDLDSEHSPEFTMIEWYQAYADYEDMMKLSEDLMLYVVKELYGNDELVYGDKTIKFKKPFNRISYIESINKKVGKDVLSMSDEELFSIAEKFGAKFEKGKRHRAHAYDRLFSMLVQPELIQPTFVVDFPKETSPLTRPKRGDPRVVERFEMYCGAMELTNAYSELNNPIIQRRNFEEEAKKSRMGDKEAEPTDMAFVEAMEYGMPPTGGLGLGIDRFVMLLTNKTSIKEVILFPMEKRGVEGKKS